MELFNEWIQLLVYLSSDLHVVPVYAATTITAANTTVPLLLKYNHSLAYEWNESMGIMNWCMTSVLLP